MGTGVLQTDAQKYHTRQTMFLAKEISYLDNGVAVSLGKRPANSIVVNSGVIVTQAFNAGTTNTLNLGNVPDDDGYASLIALGTVGRILADDMATSNDLDTLVDVEETATVVLTGTAATTGRGIAFVEYMTYLPR